MTKKVFNMAGGLHSAAAYSALENRAYGNCVASTGSFVVSSGTGMSLNISSGDGLISADANLARRIQTDATENVTVTAASASFNRIDSVVAYIDTSVTPTTSVLDNSNDILMFKCVAGTASGSPTPPSGAAIQSSIGAGNPYMVLYDALIPQNATNTSGVTFTDRRKIMTEIQTSQLAALSVTDAKIAGVSAGKFSNPYKWSAYCSTGKAIVNGSLIVDFQTELFDTNNNFASSRYTAPISGFYQVNAQAWLGTSGTGTNEYGIITIRKNGSATNMPVSQQENGSGNADKLLRPSISTLMQLSAGDYIEVWATFIGSRDIVASQSATYFNGFLVSAT